VVVHHEIDHLDGILFIDRLERVEDLYTIVVDDCGQRVRHAASEFSRSFPLADPVVVGRLQAVLMELRGAGAGARKEDRN
jgi:hypothetical protein